MQKKITAASVDIEALVEKIRRMTSSAEYRAASNDMQQKFMVALLREFGL